MTLFSIDLRAFGPEEKMLYQDNNQQEVTELRLCYYDILGSSPTEVNGPRRNFWLGLLILTSKRKLYSSK